MSANNDPIEVTVDKRGNVIILIDRHNMSAAEVLDMAARAMLAAGYEKSHILQAALAYGGRSAANKSTPEAQTGEKESSAAAVAPPEAAPEPPKVDAVAAPEPEVEKTAVLPPPLPEIPAASKEVVTTASKGSPVVSSADKEPKAPEIQESAPIAADTKAPEAIAPAPAEPAVVAPVTAEKPAPVAQTPPPVEVPVATKAEIKAPEPAPVVSTPAPQPAVAAAEVKPEPPATSPPPFEVPPLAKAPVIPLRTPAAPVSVMGTPAAPKEEAVSAEKPVKSKMDEILEADRKRIQALIAANGGTKAPAEPPSAAPEQKPVTPVVPPVSVIPAAPVAARQVTPPVPVMVNTVKPQEAEPIKEIAAEQEEWQGQKFDPATSTSMLIPPMPGMSDDENEEPVVDRPLAPPQLPKKPVSVVTPAMMARPITAEVAPTPSANIPPPPAGGPVSMLSRITGFVKLNTIAIPHYQAETVESTINTPKPVTPSVLSPQPPPTPAKR